MQTDYDSITAAHYAAFRPPLHKRILKKCIGQKEKYIRGIDIGCGTGQSSIALTDYCEKVIAIDPSTDMLKKAILHPNIEYQHYNGKTLEFENNSFDIVTFAGSLYYAKSQELLNELVRITQNGGLVVVYDFDILLHNILQQLQFENDKKSNYNHEADFNGLQENHILPIKKGNEKEMISIETFDLAHLILSVKEQYLFFEKQLGASDLHARLIERLNKLSGANTFKIDTILYYKTYEVSKPIQINSTH